MKDAPRFNISRDAIWDLLLYILISGVAGARLFHVILNLSYYASRPLEIIMFQKGGLAIHGGIIFAILVGIVVISKKRLAFWKTADLIILYLPLGQAIGRLGCFLNGCCYGKWGHPVQIYSSIALLTLFFALKLISQKKRRFDGEIFLLYFLLYCPIRFALDFLRGDLTVVLFGLTTSQIVNILLFVTALSICYFKTRSKR
jgi:phosphatidylglycerol:prolipoprotein diacylglycerol transferase